MLATNTANMGKDSQDPRNVTGIFFLHGVCIKLAVSFILENDSSSYLDAILTFYLL